jgi:hypothetical protein
VAKADVLEAQLAEYVRHFNPSVAVRRAVVRRLKAQATTHRDEEGARRRAIEGQLARAKDLYLLGSSRSPSTRVGSSQSLRVRRSCPTSSSAAKAG